MTSSLRQLLTCVTCMMIVENLIESNIEAIVRNDYLLQLLCRLDSVIELFLCLHDVLEQNK